MLAWLQLLGTLKQLHGNVSIKSTAYRNSEAHSILPYPGGKALPPATSGEAWNIATSDKVLESDRCSHVFCFDLALGSAQFIKRPC